MTVKYEIESKINGEILHFNTLKDISNYLKLNKDTPYNYKIWKEVKDKNYNSRILEQVCYSKLGY